MRREVDSLFRGSAGACKVGLAMAKRCGSRWFLGRSNASKEQLCDDGALNLLWTRPVLR